LAAHGPHWVEEINELRHSNRLTRIDLVLKPDGLTVQGRWVLRYVFHDVPLAGIGAMKRRWPSERLCPSSDIRFYPLLITMTKPRLLK
jgi:hypothetical protein